MVETVRVDFSQRYRRYDVDFKNPAAFKKFISENLGKLALIHDAKYFSDGEYTLVRISDKEPGVNEFYAQMMRGNSLHEFTISYRSIDDVLIAGKTIGFSVDMVVG